VLDRVGLPVIIRPAYILGGKGTGIANTAEEFEKAAQFGIDASPIGEILIEQSIVGWKEFELEVMRDRADNCVIVCSIENVDAMGVHTGDSITVAPAQTLSDVEYQTMRDAAFAVHASRWRGDRRVERPIRRGSGLGPSGRYRDEPTGEPVLRVGLQSNRVSRSPRSPPSSPWGTPSTRFPTTSPRRRRRASSRRSTTWSPRFRGGRSRSFPVPRACWARRCSRSARSWRSAERSPRSLQKGLRSLEDGTAGLNCDPAEARFDEFDDEELLAKTAIPTPGRILQVEAALRRGIALDRVYEATGSTRGSSTRCSPSSRNELGSRRVPPGR
jgi:carbamoyl-phosphate synthase large subunit